MTHTARLYNISTSIIKYGIDMYTLLYLKQITKKDLLYSTENASQYSVII